MIDLNQIDFGRLDAESDFKLAEYFVETGAVDAVLRGKQLVLGRKGTGKTALFIHLKGKLPAVVVDLDLNEYLFSTHRALKEAGVAESGAYTSAWKLLIFTAMLGSLEARLTRSEKSDLGQIVHDLQMADKRGRFAKILGWLKRVKRVDLPNAGELGGLGGIELSDAHETYLGADFIAAVIKLEELAKRVIVREPVTVLVDRIDDVWDGSQEAKDFIVGGLKAMRCINLLDRKAESASVILFLRTDLWQQVLFNDRNKISQDIEYLNWNDEDLISVIEARIAKSLGQESASWTSVFFEGEMRQRARSRTYVLKRTMGRPRDIVAYATFALEEARRQKHAEVLAEDLYASETRYSQHILDELSDEVGPTMEKLPNVLSVFKAIGKRSFRWEDWFLRAEQQGLEEAKAREILTQMFEASVIGMLEVGGGGGGSRSIYRYQDSYLQPHEGSLMQVHLAVAKALGLRDS